MTTTHPPGVDLDAVDAGYAELVRKQQAAERVLAECEADLEEARRAARSALSQAVAAGEVDLDRLAEIDLEAGAVTRRPAARVHAARALLRAAERTRQAAWPTFAENVLAAALAIEKTALGALAELTEAESGRARATIANVESMAEERWQPLARLVNWDARLPASVIERIRELRHERPFLRLPPGTGPHGGRLPAGMKWEDLVRPQAEQVKAMGFDPLVKEPIERRPNPGRPGRRAIGWRP